VVRHAGGDDADRRALHRAALTTEAGRQATIDQQVQSMKSMGFDVSDQMYEQMQKRSSSMPYTTGISVLVISPIIGVIFAGILFAIFNAALGGESVPSSRSLPYWSTPAR
jgi:hypothetical protein